MLTITDAQFGAMQRAGAAPLARRIFAHLRRQEIDTGALTPADLHPWVLFALDCGVTLELQIAQLVILYVAAGRPPASADASILARHAQPWHLRLGEIGGTRFDEADVRG